MTKILTEDDVIELLRRKVAKAGGQSEWAEETGINRIVINKALRKQRPPSKGLIKALNLEIVYRLKNKAPARRQG
jgi:DNA-binding phage protein